MLTVMPANLLQSRRGSQTMLFTARAMLLAIHNKQNFGRALTNLHRVFRPTTKGVISTPIETKSTEAVLIVSLIIGCDGFVIGFLFGYKYERLSIGLPAVQILAIQGY
jgi:hypothetical protein